ncbi:MAG: hypothetical protein GC155_06970 [Alphaproteobacteria bacterium]|nr:hypothetical protein [Alphaproteobacteria bacterium]
MSKFPILTGGVLPPIVTGPRINPDDLAIVRTLEAELDAAQSEGRKLSRRKALLQLVPGDDDDAVNMRRRVEHWFLKRRK